MSLGVVRNVRYTPDWVEFIPGPCISGMKTNGPGYTIPVSYDRRAAFVDTQKVA